MLKNIKEKNGKKIAFSILDVEIAVADYVHATPEEIAKYEKAAHLSEYVK